jgi:hypothetical protein
LLFVVPISSLAGTTDTHADTTAPSQHKEKVSSGEKNPVKNNIPFGKIIPEIARVAYSGGEKLYYDISWTGGVKVGELRLEIKKVPKKKDTYEILANVTTKNGVLHYIYPAKDTFVTIVKGGERLPVYYESWQKEGWHYRSHRVTRYKQEEGEVIYKKGNHPPKVFKINGTIYNEFSSFFGSRVMPLNINKPFLVPTFADKKRNEVVVKPIRKVHFDETVIGPVDTIEVTPILNFKGLYDKQGDTVIWYTDDKCRVPVLINSKIVIGSLSSTLTYYSNPACEKYSMYQAKNANSRIAR